VTQEHRTLQERLEGARTNLRFADKRIADLSRSMETVPFHAAPKMPYLGSM